MKFRRQGKELVFGKGCNGGRSSTRTYDLSHVSLSYIAKVRQGLRGNPNKTTSSADESLLSLTRSCQHHAAYVFFYCPFTVRVLEHGLRLLRVPRRLEIPLRIDARERRIAGSLIGG